MTIIKFVSAQRMLLLRIQVVLWFNFFEYRSRIKREEFNCISEWKQFLSVSPRNKTPFLRKDKVHFRYDISSGFTYQPPATVWNWSIRPLVEEAGLGNNFSFSNCYFPILLRLAVTFWIGLKIAWLYICVSAVRLHVYIVYYGQKTITRMPNTKIQMQRLIFITKFSPKYYKMFCFVSSGFININQTVFIYCILFLFFMD